MPEPEQITLDDYHRRARELLPAEVYDFIAGGAGDEWTLAENERGFERWVIRPRHLRGSGDPDPSTSVLRERISFPVLVAPWACHVIAHEEAEVGTARGAADAGTIAVISSRSSRSIEDVAASTTAPKWWQLYIFEDREATSEMIARVVSAGYSALCLTVDFPVAGLRRRDHRSGYSYPDTEYGDHDQDPGLSWADVGWVRERAPDVPFAVKGILTGEDAELAVQAGVDAIVVSNHGGRQLDGVSSGIDALSEVVDATGGRIPVLVDGGVRRGTDVLKALALGAAAVLIGRPAAWGLAVAGREGVAGVLAILREEFENAMALSGCRTVAEIDRHLVGRRPS